MMISSSPPHDYFDTQYNKNLCVSGKPEQYSLPFQFDFIKKSKHAVPL